MKGRDDFEAVMAIPLGSLAGSMCGLILGVTLFDDVARALVGGAIVGLLLGTVLYVVLEDR